MRKLFLIPVLLLLLTGCTIKAPEGTSFKIISTINGQAYDAIQYQTIDDGVELVTTTGTKVRLSGPYTIEEN